jgi:hypothetical protein
LLAALLLFKHLLILLALLAKLGLGSAICWLGADSLLVSNSPRPSNSSAAIAAQTIAAPFKLVELSTT